jgi:CBS domain-containing protein
MLSVRDLMIPEPITVDAEDTLRSAADLLISAGISGAPVMAAGRVVGIVSLTDLMAFAVTESDVPVPGEIAVHCQDIAQGDGEAPDSDAWFATLWENSESEMSARVARSDTPARDPLDEHTVGDVMTRVVFQVEPDASLAEAARIMAKERIHRLLVTDEGGPVGILTAWDIVRAVARGKLVSADAASALVE